MLHNLIGQNANYLMSCSTIDNLWSKDPVQSFFNNVRYAHVYDNDVTTHIKSGELIVRICAVRFRSCVRSVILQ